MFLSKVNYLTFCAVVLLFTTSIAPNLYGNPTTNPPIQTEETCSLPAPAWIQTTATTATTISIEWAAVSGAEDYVVEAFEGGSLAFEDYFTGTSATITGLLACTYYDIRVTPRCVGGERGSTGYHGGTTQCIIIDDLMASYQSESENDFRDVLCGEIFNLSTLREVFMRINTNALYAAQADKKFSVFNGLTNVYENGESIYLLHVKHENPLENEDGFIFANEWAYYPCNYNSLTATYVDIYFGKGSSNNLIDKATEDHIYIGRLYLSRFIENDQVMFSVCPELRDPYTSIQVWTANLSQRSDDSPAAVLAPEVQVSPNPFTDQLSIAFSAPIQTTTTFYLFDLNGKQLLQQQLEPGISGQVNIPTANLATGTYIARWQNAHTTQTTKVVKID